MLAALIVPLSACSGSPAALRHHRPERQPAATLPGTPPAGDDAAIQPPGDPTDFGVRYSPSIDPTFGSDGRFYGYN